MTRRILLPATLLLLLPCSLILGGEEAVAAPARSLALLAPDAVQDGKGYSFGGQILNMMLALGFIVLLLFLAGWLFKRLSSSRMRFGNHSHYIKIIERRPIAPKTTLYLIDIAGKKVVISDAQGVGARTLLELPDDFELPESHQQGTKAKEKPLLAQLLQSKLKT